MTQTQTDTTIADAIDDANVDTPVVPLDQRAETIQMFADRIERLWEYHPAPEIDAGGSPVKDDDGNPVYQDLPDFDTMTDGEIESCLVSTSGRAATADLYEGLLSDKDGGNRIARFTLDMYEKVAGAELKAARAAINAGDTKARDYELIDRAFTNAGEKFIELLDGMVAHGTRLATTVACINHKAVTFKGGHTAPELLFRVFPTVKGSKTESRVTAASWIK